MSDTVSTKSLVEKLVRAIIEIGGFKADKTNTYQNYDYISADAVLERGGLALANQGLVLIPAITETKISRENVGTKTRIDAEVIFEMTLTDGDTQLVESWVGHGSDTSTPDKAVYKAITSGHKYFMMKLLQISVGNSDSEHENVEDTSSKTEKKTVKKSATASNPTIEKIIAIAKANGGSGNPKLMEIMQKYEPTAGNPNKIKNADAELALLEELEATFAVKSE